MIFPKNVPVFCWWSASRIILIFTEKHSLTAPIYFEKRHLNKLQCANSLHFPFKEATRRVWAYLLVPHLHMQTPWALRSLPIKLKWKTNEGRPPKRGTPVRPQTSVPRLRRLSATPPLVVRYRENVLWQTVASLKKRCDGTKPTYPFFSKLAITFFYLRTGAITSDRITVAIQGIITAGKDGIIQIPRERKERERETTPHL